MRSERPTGIGSRFRTTACLFLLAGTALTGLLLHGQIPHGDALAETASSASGGSLGMEVVHLVFAAGLTFSSLWHVVHRRRQLLGFARRRSGKALRSLLAYLVLVGLLVASIVTAFVGDGLSQLAHHMAVSSILLVAYAWHGGRRMARRRRSPRRVPVEARP